MHQGNWTCSSCGGTITELPFIPRSESGLTCRSCYGKQKSKSSQPAPELSLATEPPDIPFDAEVANEPPPFDDDGLGAVPVSNEKPKISGNWQCAMCGGAITSLPFTPRSTENLKCLDCFKSSKR